MYVYPIRPELGPRPIPVPVPEVEPRVAVLLNANAKKVNERVRRALSHVVPERDLFIAHSFEDARQIAETVVDRRYRTVFTGGGDGTFVGFLNEIFNVIERKQASNIFTALRVPRFGVLKLGTGNALANACGASSSRSDGYVDDVLRARANEVPSVAKLELLVTEGKRTPFAGLGLDAGILNHFFEVKRAAANSPFASMMAGGVGYAVAIAGRSVPSYLMQSRPRIEVRTRGVAHRLDSFGRPVGPALGPGATLYTGPALIAAVSTIPCYGYNFKLFPFAGSRRGMMQLRIGNVSVPAALARLPSLWQGTSFEGVFDFWVEDVEVRVDRKAPFQIGGDAEGYRDYARFTMWKDAVELMDFSSTQCV